MVKRLGLKNPSTYSVISDNLFYERFDIPAEMVCWGTVKPDAEVRVIGHFHLNPDALGAVDKKDFAYDVSLILGKERAYAR